MLLRSVEGAVDSACRRYNWARQKDAAEIAAWQYDMFHRFDAGWRRYVREQRAEGRAVLLVEGQCVRRATHT